MPNFLTVETGRSLRCLFRPELVGQQWNDVKQACIDLFPQVQVSLDKCAAIEQLTRTQCRSRYWFQFREGRITASLFKEVILAKSPPPKSLITRICYPQAYSFSNKATRLFSHF